MVCFGGAPSKVDGTFLESDIRYSNHLISQRETGGKTILRLEYGEDCKQTLIVLQASDLSYLGRFEVNGLPPPIIGNIQPVIRHPLMPR